MYATRLEGALYVDETDRELEFQSPPNPQDCLFRLHPQHRFAALKVPHNIPSAGEAVGQFLRCTARASTPQVPAHRFRPLLTALQHMGVHQVYTSPHPKHLGARNAWSGGGGGCRWREGGSFWRRGEGQVHHRTVTAGTSLLCGSVHKELRLEADHNSIQKLHPKVSRFITTANITCKCGPNARGGGGGRTTMRTSMWGQRPPSCKTPTIKRTKSRRERTAQTKGVCLWGFFPCPWPCPRLLYTD